MAKKFNVECMRACILCVLPTVNILLVSGPVYMYVLHLPLARARVTVPRHKGSSECARSDRVQMLGAMGIE